MSIGLLDVFGLACIWLTMLVTVLGCVEMRCETLLC
jgi:hypothetical protein